MAANIFKFLIKKMQSAFCNNKVYPGIYAKDKTFIKDGTLRHLNLLNVK